MQLKGVVKSTLLISLFILTFYGVILLPINAFPESGQTPESEMRYHDHHNHVALYIAFRSNLNVYGMEYDTAISEMMKLPKDELNVVIGFALDQEKLKSDIEKLPPVLICHLSLHSFLINEEGKKMLKEQINTDFVDEFIENIRNNVWIEKNLSTILVLLCNLQEYTVGGIENYFAYLDGLEVYSTEEMLTPNMDFVNKTRSSAYKGRCEFHVSLRDYQDWGKDVKELLGAIKIFLDGAFSQKTAAIKDGYVNPECGKDGLVLYSDEELAEILRYVESEKRDLRVHAIGDLAIEQLLRVIEKEKIEISDISIEHAMFINKEQAKRCKKLGITLCMQPNFSADAVMYAGILKPEILSRMNPFRMLIDEEGFVPGEDLIFGTDGMPQGIENAWDLSNYEGMFKSQYLSREEFDKGFTKKIKGKKALRRYPVL